MRVFILTAAAALAMSQPHNAQEITEAASEKINSLCRESKYTKKLAEHIAAQAKLPLAQITTARNYVEAWKLLAHTATSAEEQAATRALAQYVARKIDAAVSTMQQRKNLADDAIKWLHRRSAAARANFDARIAANSGNAEHSGVGPRNCKLTIAAVAGHDNSCQETESNTNEPEGTSITLNTATQLKLLQATQIKPRDTIVTSVYDGVTTNINRNSGTKCEHSASASANYNDMQAAATAAESQLAAEVVKLKPGTGTAVCGNEDGDEAKTELDNELIARKICKFITHQIDQVPDVNALDPTTLAADGEVQETYKMHLAAAGKLQESSDVIQQALKAIYGTDNNGFKSKFLQKLQDTKVKFKPDKSAEPESIIEVVQKGAAQKALTYIQSKEMSKAPKTKSSTGGQEQQPDYKSRKKDDCENDNECQWKGTIKDGKCQAKGGEEGVKAEEKKEEKCAGKLEPDCTKGPECKWKGKKERTYG